MHVGNPERECVCQCVCVSATVWFGGVDASVHGYHDVNSCTDSWRQVLLVSLSSAQTYEPSREGSVAGGKVLCLALVAQGVVVSCYVCVCCCVGVGVGECAAR